MKTPHSKQVHHPSCLHMHPNNMVPHLWKTPANQDTHMVTRSHATQATHTQAPFLLFQLEAQHYPTPISIILFFKKKSIILSYGHWPEVSCNLSLVAALGHCCRLQLQPAAESGTQQQSGPLLLLLQRQSTVVCGYLLDSYKNPKQSKQRL